MVWEHFFWKEAWLVNEPFCLIFPMLFSLATNKEYCVGDMWPGGGIGGRRGFEWRRELFVWERDLLHNLEVVLEEVVVGGGPDRWVWKPEVGGIFSVKSCYASLQKLDSSEGELSTVDKVVFGDLWKCGAPSKALAFSWKLILDRIPSKVNLAKRRLLASEDSKMCVFCGLFDETSIHLFLHCNVISQVWREVMNWMELNFITPPILSINFICWSSAMRSKKSRKGVMVIWHAVIWIIWNPECLSR